MSRWVVREGTVRGAGRYLDMRWQWRGDRDKAFVYGRQFTDARGSAKQDAKHNGGRVVKLVAKRKATREAWKAQAVANHARAQKAEAEVERLKDEVARCWSMVDEARVERDQAHEAADKWKYRLASSVSANVRADNHARRWKALAKRLRVERDNAALAVRAVQEPKVLDDAEVERLNDAYFAAWHSNWCKTGRSGCREAAIRAVLRAAGRYKDTTTNELIAHEKAREAALQEALGGVDACWRDMMSMVRHLVSKSQGEVERPLRRREVSDEEVSRAVYAGMDGTDDSYDRKSAYFRDKWTSAGRAAIDLATRPAVPPTEEQLRATYDSTQHLLSLRRVWNLEGRSTITREEFERAYDTSRSMLTKAGLESALNALGLKVEGT